MLVVAPLDSHLRLALGAAVTPWPMGHLGRARLFRSSAWWSSSASTCSRRRHSRRPRPTSRREARGRAARLYLHEPRQSSGFGCRGFGVGGSWSRRTALISVSRFCCGDGAVTDEANGSLDTRAAQARRHGGRRSLRRARDARRPRRSRPTDARRSRHSRPTSHREARGRTARLSSPSRAFVASMTPWPWGRLDACAVLAANGAFGHARCSSSRNLSLVVMVVGVRFDVLATPDARGMRVRAEIMAEIECG